MGPGVTCPILRYHPAIIAQAAATVSCFAPGRAYLAVGTGEALNEDAATGKWPGYEERQKRNVSAKVLFSRGCCCVLHSNTLPGPAGAAS